MQFKFYSKRILLWIGRRGITSGLLVLIAVVYILGINQASDSQKAEAARTMQQSILRAAMNCYAIEGRFPSSLNYLRENYDVLIDTDNYIVHYSVFASNLMPDIQVTGK